MANSVAMRYAPRMARQIDETELHRLETLLRSGPRTFDEIREALGTEEKTTYRHLERLDQRLPGTSRIVRLGVGRPVRYVIPERLQLV